MTGHEWREDEKGEVDLLFRAGIQVGEVRRMGGLWVGTTWRPPLREGEEVGGKERAVKAAKLTRAEARAMTEESVTYHWGGMAAPRAGLTEIGT